MSDDDTTTAHPGLLARLKEWWRQRPPLYRWLLAVPAALVTAAALIWGGIGVYSLVPRDEPPCPRGLTWDSGTKECYGVTDGSYAFFEQLGPVSQRIKEENERVEGFGEPYTTVAMMIPMAPAPDNEVERVQVLRELQGAYLAQYRANARGKDSPKPLIRLVMANPGRSMDHWRAVSDDLVKLTRSDDRLRAVFGFNVSVSRTEQTIRYLTRRHGIPVVGGPITAHTLANDQGSPERYPGLAKIVPDNVDQARALAKHLDVRPEQTYLIEDTSQQDLYARSLRTAFREVTRGTRFAPEEYDADNVTPNDFEDMVRDLCTAEDLDTVFFAGRPPELADLIEALGTRTCPQRRITIATVSGASTIALEQDISWEVFTRQAGIEVVYATVTHSEAWTGPQAPAHGGSKDDYARLSDLVEDKKQRAKVGPIGPTGLADGRTITMHDSALTAIEGIRNRTTATIQVPSLDSVREAWRRLHGSQTVRGASGWICLRNYGTPYNKAVAIVALSPKGDHIDFKTLAWPEQAPKRLCKAPPE